MNLTLPERRLANWMRAFAAVFALAALASALGTLIGPFAKDPAHLPFLAAASATLFGFFLVAVYAGGSPRERIGLTWVLAASQGLVIAAPAALQLSGHHSRAALPAIVIAATIGVLALLKGAAALSAAREAVPGPADTRAPLLGAESRLRAFLFLQAILYAASAVLLTLGAMDAGEWAPAASFLAATAVLAGTVTLVALFVAGDVHLRRGASSILVLALLVSAAAQLRVLLAGGLDAPVALIRQTLPLHSIVLLGAIGDAVAALLLLALLRAARLAVYAPRFLSLRGFRCLNALAEVLVVGPDARVDAASVACNADKYFSNITANRRVVDRIALFVVHFHPAFYLKPPIPELDPVIRIEHLKQHFYLDIKLKLIPMGLRQWIQALIRLAKQLTYVGYYNDKRTDASVGYVRFEQRERMIGKVPAKVDVVLTVSTPETIARLEERDVDVCVIGSGAAGAVLAYRLAEAGNSVLVVERGRFVRPTEFDDDEVGMIAKLYDDGIFQQTRDFRFTILQGSCVGGSTVVNNAVCFPTPDPVLANWNDKYKWNAGIKVAEYQAGTKRIQDWLPITSQKNAYLNPSGKQYTEGAIRLGHPLEVNPVNANIRDCIGCGYCNIGCAYERKLSMLVTVLPWAQAKFGKDRFRIQSQARVTKIVNGSNGSGGRRVTVVEAELPDGRTLRIRPKKVVVAAGAIASSYLLQQSGIGRGLPVGQGMSFNMGSAMTGDFPDKLDAYDGLQISHYGLPRPGRGWVFETWWNPPVAQALNMPGWFEDHYNNMRRYDHLMGVGVLVGTESTATVSHALLGGPDVTFTPSDGDRRRLADGLMELGQVLFAEGATRVMVNGWEYHEFTNPAALSELVPICLDPVDLTVGTGHPQGGNAMSQSPERGVVGPDFRVHGWANLFVCDASVIPSSLTVNPQLTIMSLAEYAAPRIAQARG